MAATKRTLVSWRPPKRPLVIWRTRRPLTIIGSPLRRLTCGVSRQLILLPPPPSRWALAGVCFALISESKVMEEDRDSPPSAPSPPGSSLLPRAIFSPVGYRLLFAVVLGLLGVTDAISWLATSLPAFREMRLQVSLASPPPPHPPPSPRARPGTCTLPLPIPPPPISTLSPSHLLLSPPSHHPTSSYLHPLTFADLCPSSAPPQSPHHLSGDSAS